MGPGAPSTGDLFWTGTLFLPSERSQPGMPDGACHDAPQGVTSICAASGLADLLDKTLISDELASDAGTDHLANLLGQFHVSSEPAADLESVGSTDPMPVDSDTASYDTFPTNVAIYNDPLPRTDGCDAVTAEVMVVGHGGLTDESAHDASRAAAHDLSVPLPADAGDEALEARRLALLAEGRKLVSMRRLVEAHRREADRAAFGTPPRRA